jgi:hypothetical protein
MQLAAIKQLLRSNLIMLPNQPVFLRINTEIKHKMERVLFGLSLN